MKAKALKIGYVSIAAALFITSVPFVKLSKTKAFTFRTEYTIYGDVNNDKVIDSFDVIALNKIIANEQYDKLYDLNCDEKTDSEDVALLRKYILGDKTIFEAYCNDDTDGDFICDLTEITEFGTDPDSADTDNDGLSDLEEIVSTKTSPFDKFSNGTTISDGEFDSDSDGFSNAKEVKLKTDPLNEDTDYDGLTDYEEINKYKTDPVNYDSDGDYIPDGDEIVLSYDPNKKSTDGTKNDNEIITEQYISADSELLKEINTNASIAEMSINISASGLAERSFKVESSKYNNVISYDNEADNALDLSYNPNLKINNLRLNFQLKKELKGNEEITDYMIFRFYPDHNILLPLETKYDNIDNDDKADDVLYTIIDGFSSLSELGTFKVINAKEYSQNITNSLQKIYDSYPEPKLSHDRYSKIVFEGADSNIYSTPDEAFNDILRKINICEDIAQYVFAIDYQNFASQRHHIQLDYIFNGTKCLETESVNRFNYDSYGIGHGGTYNIEGVRSSLEKDSNFSKYFKNYLYEPEEESYAINTSALGWAEHIERYFYNASERKYNYCFIIANRIHDVDESVYQKINKYGVKFYYIVPSSSYNSEAAQLAEKYGNKVYTYDNYQLAFSDMLADKLNNSSLGLNNKMLPVEIPKEINLADFFTMLPKNYDKSELLSSDVNGKVDFYEACVKSGVASKDKYGNVRFKSLYDFCAETKTNQNGLQQLKQYMGDYQFQAISMLNMIPYFEVAEYKDETSKTEYVEAGTWNGKYCYPPTYYSEIIPENYAIREEGVNGETKDGKWSYWY